MRKICILSIALLTGAWSQEYTQADRILDMQRLAHAMQDIQSGFFYNNLDIVTAGAKSLKETIIKVKTTKEEKDTKDIYERWMNNNNAMTLRMQKKLVKYADTIVERFRDGDAVQALQVYNRATAECMKCHVDLRHW